MLENQFKALAQATDEALAGDFEEINIEESGTVVLIDSGIAKVRGLKKVKNEELIAFPNGTMGLAFNLDPEEIGVILLGSFDGIKSGQKVKRTYKVADIPVSDEFLGRVISPLGEILDGQGPVTADKSLPVEREAPSIMKRAPVFQPLQTGVKVIDSVVPVGRGQRELILGDRQTGKTAIAIDTILNQKDTDVLCIYCAIGQQITSVSKIIDTLKSNDAMANTIVMVAGSEDPPGLSYIAPYAATSLGEYFMEQGRDVLIVYDDLTRHARAYRELSLLLERPPGREAYPGDIFYIHSRLLERSTHLRDEFGGGSITSLPIIETQAENLSAYIPTNLISITDGQIYLSPKLYQKGNLPAVQIGLSVSRIGAKTQLPSYRSITGALKLTYSQFEELESFASFGTRLDEATRRTLERGRRIRQVLNQPQNLPIEVTEQIGVLMAVTGGVLDEVPLERIDEAEEHIRKTVREDEAFRGHLLGDEKPSDEVKEAFLERIRDILKQEMES
ncbi:MAG TPA: alternate F1F0 ATPase, F1 subunit alpha [Anaerovoracaceae bacterium]|jgi:F-type H+-transporting ATPase subunit alpha|nr:alternate F1F0 ATPase, F1 subunit alpha [Eubacteriales bacterium]HPF19387.1 alternate F1F0 ATPase, F1 subunit alpha [Bacillota bacterium]HRV32701.1 alternate F1F0 ATPase, F1 subunit alpha [Anaerovoracaceae bacterium]MDD3290373.1 alternate F1F0 ATPase, F1 subunit alpha [Eubacteriales bacterium]MDD3864338.1 alternate F1F0 ATPase, F1 subunit alpha [Eubacteriales bacterium]